MWKISQYTVVKNLAQHNLPEYNLIFNTQTHFSYVVKEKDWVAILEALNKKKNRSSKVGQSIIKLVSTGIFVASNVDENKTFSSKFDHLRYHPKKIYPLIAITSACNIGCTYCYEEGIKSKTMSMDVVKGALKWIEDRVVEDEITEIYPGLFGGEPLLYPRLLFAIMDGFAEISKRLNVKGEFFTSSNGIFLTTELAAQLASKGLTQIQISLDGPEIIHDVRRIGKKGQPSFQGLSKRSKKTQFHI